MNGIRGASPSGSECTNGPDCDFDCYERPSRPTVLPRRADCPYRQMDRSERSADAAAFSREMPQRQSLVAGGWSRSPLSASLPSDRPPKTNRRTE